MTVQDKVKREVLPIPDKPYMGLTTYTAKDPDTSFPKFEPVLAEYSHPFQPSLAFRAVTQESY